MNDEAEIRMVADGVAWTVLKKDLADDEFDNGRTPEQLNTSFDNSFAVAFAWADDSLCRNRAAALVSGM